MRYATLDWNGDPITCDEEGKILPREAEMIIHGSYYPTRQVGDYPTDPETGDPLPVFRGKVYDGTEELMKWVTLILTLIIIALSTVQFLYTALS